MKVSNLVQLAKPLEGISYLGCHGHNIIIGIFLYEA